MKVTSSLTVYFEAPFWVGVYQRETEQGLEACKILFGAEPKEVQVYQYLLSHWRFLRFSPPVKGAEDAAPSCLARKNPKRVQREIRKSMEHPGTGTKAQNALKLQFEQQKQERKIRSRQERETESRQRFALHQQKKREKHKGH